MEKLTWRIRLVLTVGLVGPFVVFVAALFLSDSAAIGSADAVTIVSQARAATMPVAAEPEERPATIMVGASDYGQILFDGRGRALYAFTRDPRGRSACAGPCADSWPPYLLRGALRAGAGAEASLLATTQRPNGARQVTYGGRPLYYWIGDREPGEVGCQNVFEFGGLWLVVRGTGQLVR